MENSKQPIVPITIRQIGDNEWRIASEKDINVNENLKRLTGLTKREYFAGLAMQGILAGKDIDVKFSSGVGSVADMAISYANELLKQLGEEKIKEKNV